MVNLVVATPHCVHPCPKISMKKPLARKIIEEHLVSGTWQVGAEIGIRIDQTLTQDATGTLAYLEFESMDVGCIKTELSVSYVDHNLLQTDYKNADDHRFLQSVAQRFGIYFLHLAMVFHTRFIWNASALPARRYWAPTATPLWVAHWA